MNKGINLLEKKIQAPITKAVLRLRFLRGIAISMLFAISAASVVLFLLIALSPLPSLQKREEEVLRVLSAHHADMAKLEIIKERLNISSVIIINRNDLGNSLDRIIDKMPTELSVTAVKMKDKQVLLTVSGTSLSSLETFLDNLTKDSDEKKDFASVTLQEFIASSGNAFSVKVSVLML